MPDAISPAPIRSAKYFACAHMLEMLITGDVLAPSRTDVILFLRPARSTAAFPSPSLSHVLGITQQMSRR